MATAYRRGRCTFAARQQFHQFSRGLHLVSQMSVATSGATAGLWAVPVASCTAAAQAAPSAFTVGGSGSPAKRSRPVLSSMQLRTSRAMVC